jgi:hypothetical protein
MSAHDPETALAPIPDVPSTARLAWLLFMQPIKLQHMLTTWGLVLDPSLWSLRLRWRSGDPHIRQLITRLFSLSLFWAPTIAISAVFVSGVRPLSKYLLGFAVGLTIWHAWSIGTGLVRGIKTSVNWLSMSIIIFLFLKIDSGAELDSSPGLGLLAALAYGTTTEVAAIGPWGASVARSIYLFMAVMGLFLSLGGFLFSYRDSSLLAILGLGMAASTARLHLYLFEALFVMRLALIARDPERGPRLVLRLPYRYDDLILFPLPGLQRVLIDLAEHSPNLARRLIDEASTTIAQKKPARRAFDELQARDLRQAAETAAWQRVVDLRGNFFPSYTDIPADDPLRKFIASATDLHAAASGGSQRRRAGLLDKAARQIDDIKRSYLAASLHDHRATLLHDVAGAWSRVIAAKRDALTREIEVNPEIPNVFVVGPSLNPGDPEEIHLFRPRRDLIDIIDHDLDDAQRGVLFLVGQRRMGKTSLLAMLPTYLGTATTVVTCDFQGLSGSEHPQAPHRWVVRLLAEALARVPNLALPALAITDVWGSALDFLIAVDAELARIDHRVLVAIDEVENLQIAVQEGRGSLTFLDFVRAAGDKLHRIRLLLVSAHRLASPKLGPVWVTRLISVLPRTLGPLDPDDAKDLIRRPVPTFPDIFDDDTARTILAQTGRHPYLIQAVGREVVKRLLKDKRRVATTLDIERAFDGVIEIADGTLFSDLWNSFEPAEQAVMRALAAGAAVDPENGTFRVLREQWFVDLRDGRPAIAFPLFGRWIRDYRGEHLPRPDARHR